MRVPSPLRRLLGRLDIDIDRTSRQTPAQRVRFMEQEGINVVIEVGAFAGRYGKSLRANGYLGRIESFEPLPEAFELLRQATDAKWHAHNQAIGAECGRKTIRVAANLESSSFLPMLDSHLEAAPHAIVHEEMEVDVVTIDSTSLVGHSDRAMLVLDVQGFEREVLEGASRTLSQVRLIEIELSTTRLYEGQVLVEDHIASLRHEGFELIWMEPCFRHPRTNRVLQYDGLLARRGG